MFYVAFILLLAPLLLETKDPRGAGTMDGVPYNYRVPRRNWQYTGSPWGRNAVMSPNEAVMSPYEAEKIDPMTEPCHGYHNGWIGPSPAHHVSSRQNRQHKTARSARAANRAAPSVIRNIVVTDGREDQRDQHQVKEEQNHGVPQKQKHWQPRFENADAAATCIQRRYIGHHVRKTDPVKQLRVIKQVRDASKEFQERACDPEFLRKLRDDKMERLRFEEGLMREVLKLDSLQGVHPFVRDVRKAAARDLVRLQDATEAALESGRPITPDDLKCVDVVVDALAEGEGDMDVDGEASEPHLAEATSWSPIKPVPL